MKTKIKILVTLILTFITFSTSHVGVKANEEVNSNEGFSYTLLINHNNDVPNLNLDINLALKSPINIEPPKIEEPKPVVTTPAPVKQAPKPVAKAQPVVVQQPIAVNGDYAKQRICEVFGPQCQNALIVAKGESTFRTNAISPTNDYGILQINCPSHISKVTGKKYDPAKRYECNALLDLETNLRIAKGIYDAQGWCPWTAARKAGLCPRR